MSAPANRSEPNPSRSLDFLKALLILAARILPSETITGVTVLERKENIDSVDSLAYCRSQVLPVLITSAPTDVTVNEKDMAMQTAKCLSLFCHRGPDQVPNCGAELSSSP
jgi:hypothetical protein